MNDDQGSDLGFAQARPSPALAFETPCQGLLCYLGQPLEHHVAAVLITICVLQARAMWKAFRDPSSYSMNIVHGLFCHKACKGPRIIWPMTSSTNVSYEKAKL